MQVISSYQQDVNIPLGPESPYLSKESKSSEPAKESKLAKGSESPELAKESKESKESKGSWPKDEEPWFYQGSRLCCAIPSRPGW